VAAKPVLEKKDGDHLGIPLGDMVDIRLGGVTGHAEYFLMTEPQREALRLPPEAVYPVLSRSRHLKSAMIDHRLWLKLLREGERVWLFRPTNDIVSHPAVIDYLSRSKRSGGCNRKRYKIKQRTPWYLTPLPDHVDGFLSGMTKLGPWIALCRMEGLNATNTLYVVRFKGKKDACSKSAIALAMLTSTVRETLGRRCRRYPDGLIKHEPGDLMSVRVPVAKDPRGASAVYSGAVTSLLKGNVVEATSRADRFFNL